MFSLYPEAGTIYREYLQNATDSIEEACEAGILDSIDEGHITIKICQPLHSVTIQDNGIGIPADYAESTLKDIAKTSKRKKDYLAGYYGIGRLVGAGYCKQLIFETSAKGEEIESKIVFDVDKIRSILADEENDMGASEPTNLAQWFIAGKFAKFETVSYTEHEDSLEISFTYNGTLFGTAKLIKINRINEYFLKMPRIRD